MSNLALQKRIRKLLSERNAILLVHYYQREEIQEIADILGDSLALSMEASRTDAEVIVFAGVHFMAESASIISPEKTVLLPRLDAGCPLADTIDRARLEQVKRENPTARIVTYINSSAAVKSVSDICCTSANAIKVVESLDGAHEIFMVPDGNLAQFVARFTKKRVVPWAGYCPVHHFLSVATIRSIQEQHPRALFAAHPECTSSVLALADYVGSTAGILRYARECDAEELIVGTEMGIMARLKKENPHKLFVPAAKNLVCHTMKSITLEDIFVSLKEMRHVIKVREERRSSAKEALDRMLMIH
jgi:quinolinate synthase